MESSHKEHKSKKRKHKSKDHKDHKAHKEKRRHKQHDDGNSSPTATARLGDGDDGVKTVGVPLLPPTSGASMSSAAAAKSSTHSIFSSALGELDAFGGGIDSDSEDADSSDDDHHHQPSSATSKNANGGGVSAGSAIVSDSRTFASMLSGLSATATPPVTSSPSSAAATPATGTTTSVGLDDLVRIQQTLQDQVNSATNRQLIEQITTLPAMLFGDQHQHPQGTSQHHASGTAAANETSSLLAALNNDPSILAMKPAGLSATTTHPPGSSVPPMVVGGAGGGGASMDSTASTSSSISTPSTTKPKKAKKPKTEKDGSSSSSSKKVSSNAGGSSSNSSSLASGSGGVNTVAAMAARALEQQDAEVLASDNPLHTRWMMATALKEKGIKYRTGTFSAQEDEIIRQTIRDYVKRHNMAPDAIERWFENGNGRGRFEKNDLKALWVEIAVRLQTRPLLNIYLHVRRMFHPQNNVGAWSKEDDAKLIQLYTKYKGQWTTIGNELGRMADSCRDRYRNHLKDQSTMVAGPWSQQEDEKLLTIMQELAVLQGKSSILESQPMWTLISERMGGTRTRHQCRHRYSQTLQPRLERGEWTGPSTQAAVAAAQAAANASSAAMAALEQQKAVQAAAAASSGQSSEDALFIAAAMQMPNPTATASTSSSLWTPELPDTSSALTNPATGGSLMVSGGGNDTSTAASPDPSSSSSHTLAPLHNPLQPPKAPKGPIRRRGGLQQQLDVLKMIQESGVMDHTEIQWADIAARLRAAVQESNEAHLANVTNSHAQLISQEAELQGGHNAVAAAAATAAMAAAVAAARAQAVQRLQKVPAANQIARTFMSSRCKTPNYRQLPLQEVVKLMMLDVEKRILRRQRGRRAVPRNLDEEAAGVKYDTNGASNLALAQQHHHQHQHQHAQHHPLHQQHQQSQHVETSTSSSPVAADQSHFHHHYFGEYALSSEMSESVQLQLNLQTQEVAERALSAQFPTIHRFQQEQALALQHGGGYVPTQRTEEEQQAMERQLQQEQHNRAMAENMLQMALANANIYTPHASFSAITPSSSSSSSAGGMGGTGVSGGGGIAHLSFHHIGASNSHGATTLLSGSVGAGLVPGSPLSVIGSGIHGVSGNSNGKLRLPKSQEIIVDSEEEDDEDDEIEDEELGAEIERDLQAMFGNQRETSNSNTNNNSNSNGGGSSSTGSGASGGIKSRK